MAVPLRVIVLVIVIVVAAVSALVVYFPNASATNAAIDTLVTELRTETSSNLVLIARSQFTPVLTLAQTMLSYLSQGSLNATDGTRLRSWAPLFCALGNTSVYLVQAGNAAKDYVGCQAGLTYYRDPVTTNLYTGVALPPLYPFPGVPQMTLMSTNYNPTTRPWYVALKNKNGWSSFYVRTGNPPTSTTAVGGPFYDAAGNVAGAMSVSMHSLSFIAAMKAVRVGLTGRAMVYDVKSGYFLAGNFNQSATVTANVTTGAQRLVWINDTRDDLIVAAVSQLGGQDALLALPSTFATSFGWQDDVVYVDITPIQDSFGLDLRLLTAIRRSDFTSDIAQQQSRAAGGAGGAVAGLAILCGLMIWAMMSPLNRLAADMNVRDSMSSDDGRNGDSRSVLSEIAEIQEAYSGLRQELQRVKSYLPQSVLRQLERGDDDDDADLVASERRSASLQRFDTASISSKHTSKSASIHNQARVLGLGSTRASSHGKDLPGAVIATMEAALAVSKRRVSMIAINVKGFHSEVMAKGETHVTTFASNFVKLLNDVATAHRGVTHLMHGDRVFLSFNAATRVAGHATQAVQAAVTIRSRAAAELKAQLTAGVATGEALVGMLGSSAQRQFTVLGKVFLNAAVLERLCSLNGFLLNTGGDAPIDGILVDRSTALPAGDTVPMRVVDVVALPQARRLQCIYTMVPTAVSAVNKEEESGADAPGEVLPNAHAETSGDGEWMYELTRARQRNPYAVYNDAMDHCTQDKHEDARQMLQAMDHPAPVMRALRDAALLRVAQLQQATTASVAMEWGVYYHSLVFVAPSA